MSERAAELVGAWPPSDARTFEHRGLLCAVCSHSMPYIGTYETGYVRVGPAHPMAGRHYDDVDVDVFGGLTFGRRTPDGCTWFGWDGCHGGPGPASGEDETRSLADQLANMAEVVS